MSTNGTVKYFYTASGYGFIAPQDGSKDVLVYISEVERAGLSTLAEHQQVSFKVQRGGNGHYSAVNLKAL
jgi:CspA family cold shock protein